VVAVAAAAVAAVIVLATVLARLRPAQRPRTTAP
jgi:hypothetical protein